MGLFLWIIIGLIVSILTLLIEPYVIRRHILITIILGVLGAIAGGAFGNYLGYNEVNGMRFMIIVYSIGASAFVLSWYRAIEKYLSQ